MYLAADEIRTLVRTKQVVIEPLDEQLFRPASYVLRIGTRFRFWKPDPKPIDLWSPDAYVKHAGDVEEVQAVTLYPGQLVIASTAERIALSWNHGGELSTLSHLARVGLSATLNATWISPGFGFANPTPLALELVNHNPSPVVIHGGMPMCHLRLAHVSGDARSISDTRSVYEGLDPLTLPLLFEDFGPRVGTDG